MTPELAVFHGFNDVALVRWVFSIDGDTLYVTDNIGLTELKTDGTTRRVLGMARSKAYKYDATVVRDGQRVDFDTLQAF